MDETHRLKEVEYYSAGVSAWYNTSLEYDKTLLALSAGGIGLLVTPLITGGIKRGSLLALYGGSLAGFLACLIILLVVFRLNRSHLESTIHQPSAGLDPLLEKLDLAAAVSFGIAVICTACIGVSAGLTSVKEGEMTKANLPIDPLNKSFAGSGALRPQVPESAPASAPAAAATPAPAPAPIASTQPSSTPSSPSSSSSK